jgi:hypothetical protein
MQRQMVESSNLRSVGYDAERSLMEVEFKNGSIYQYKGVPQAVYDELMRANSHGQYFNSKIKNGPYSYVQVG